MSIESAKNLVSAVQELVSVPEVCFNVYNMANDPLCSALAMAQAISQDPSLSTNVLKVANSPYYGFPSRVDTITRAIAVIGTQDLRELVLATSMVGAFSDLPDDTINLNAFWHHSLLTGMTARRLGGKAVTPVLRKERLFVAGLLHKIGILVMAMTRPQAFAQVRQSTPDLFFMQAKAEIEFFECDHSQVGAELMRAWHLPEMLQNVARYHLAPSQSADYVLESSIVHIASSAVAAELDPTLVGTTDLVSPDAWKLTGLTNAVVSEMVSAAISEYTEIANAFLGHARAS